MCAYLIKEDDKEIHEPIARIAIKRLIGLQKSKFFIFAAEDTIYGDEEFAKEIKFDIQVQNILNESNKLTAMQDVIYQRKDNKSYSDAGYDLLVNTNLSIEELKKYKEYLEAHPNKLEKIDWRHISTLKNLPENFIEVFAEYLDWEYISEHKHSLEFLMKFKDKIRWDYYLTQTIPYNEFTDILNLLTSDDLLNHDILFTYIKYNNLTIEAFEQLAKKYKLIPMDYLNFIKKNNNLITEEFIEKYKNKLGEYFWQNLSLSYSKFDPKFIERFKDKINWHEFTRTQAMHLSLSLIEQFKDKIDFDVLLRSLNWGNNMRQKILEIRDSKK